MAASRSPMAASRSTRDSASAPASPGPAGGSAGEVSSESASPRMTGDGADAGRRGSRASIRARREPDQMSPGKRATPARSTPAASGSMASRAPTSMPLSADSGILGAGRSIFPRSTIGSASRAGVPVAPAAGAPSAGSSGCSGISRSGPSPSCARLSSADAASSSAIETRTIVTADRGCRPAGERARRGRSMGLAGGALTSRSAHWTAPFRSGRWAAECPRSGGIRSRHR